MSARLALIGPMAVGKSTLARRLARRLDLPVLSLDRLRWRHFLALGYDRARATKIERQEGLAGLHRYRAPFEAKVVEAVTGDHREGIFDFGAGHTYFENREDAERVRRALGDVIVVLVLPSPDAASSLATIEERLRGREGERGLALARALLEDPLSRELADHVVYTDGVAPEEMCEAILAAAGIGPRSRNDPTVTLDRSSYAQHRAACAVRLRGRSDTIATLEGLQDRRRARLEANMSLDRPLSSSAVAITRETLEDVDWCVRATLARAELTDEARTRLEGIFAERVDERTTLRALLAMDPFDGIFPFQDGPVLERFATTDAPDAPLTALARETLCHRFFHRPQRTRYLFLHELVVGWFLNEMKTSGLVPAREDLMVDAASYEPLAARATELLAEGAHLSLPTLLALHGADNETVDAHLPLAIRDVLLCSAEIYFQMELFMLYLRRGATRRILTDLLLFFTLPALERVIDEPGRSLAPNAGLAIDDRFAERIYGASELPKRAPNEIDIVRILSDLVEVVFP